MSNFSQVLNFMILKGKEPDREVWVLKSACQSKIEYLRPGARVSPSSCVGAKEPKEAFSCGRFLLWQKSEPFWSVQTSLVKRFTKYGNDTR